MNDLDLLIAFLAGWLSRDIYPQIKRGTFWHRRGCQCKWCHVERWSESGSNSVTYSEPICSEASGPTEKCPHCNGYHIGGCHRR